MREDGSGALPGRPRRPPTTTTRGDRPTSPSVPPSDPTRPAHRRAGLALLVAIGGAAGSLGRYLVAEALPPQHGWPVGTLTANLVGAFLLGALLEYLGRRGPETPGVQRVRLALGTGVLGGFTTFSSLALETERLLAAGAVGTALGYAAASLVLGLGCAVTGIAVVAGRRRPGVAQ